MNFFSAFSLLAVFCCQVTLASDAIFTWIDSSDGTTDLMYGDKPVLRYMHAFDNSTDEKTHDTYKVFHHVFGPISGKTITKGAGGKYTHHRGLYVGWNKTQTPDGSFDFWHCKNGAHLQHVKFVEKSGDAYHGTMIAEIHWNDSSGKPVIVETRRVDVRPLTLDQSPAWQIDWSTKLESKRGAIHLRGDRQHAGFQYRAAQPVADADSARYLRPVGFPQEPEPFQVDDQGNPPAHINLKWFSMNYPLEGSHYTIEYFEAPGQPQPSLFSERPYGRFGAFYTADIDNDKPLTMTYRVIVSEGVVPSRNEIQKRYDEFVSFLKTTTP